MIGLVNSVGASTAARVESTTRSVRERVAEQPSNLAPILGSEQAAYKVLHLAVEALQNPEHAPPARAGPSAEESDRFAQAELESRTDSAVGARLDVTA
jgi:hypothetical protein